LEGVRLTGAVGRQESGASTVNKEHPEVAVAPFGDGPEAPGGTRGGFTGREAEIVGQAAARGKALDVTDGGHESGGREDSDAGNGHEEGDGRDEGSEALELVLEIVGLGLKLLDFKEGLGESGLEIGGEVVVVQGDMGLGQEGTRALGNREAELAQEAANRINACGPGSQVPRAQTV
jgi:hypothetical protein